MTNTIFGVNGNGANGPGASTSFSGNITLAVAFEVTSSGNQLEGYGLWRCDSAQAATASFALWQISTNNTGTLVSGSAVTITGMATGAWNYVSLSSPVSLSASTAYQAQVGMVNNFPDTNNQFGSGDPYAAGITSGPLFCYSAPTGSAPTPHSNNQCSFGVGSADPTAGFVSQASNDFNAFLDVQIAGSSTNITSSFGLAMAPLKESFTATETIGSHFGLAMAPLKESFTAAETGANVSASFGLKMAPLAMRFAQSGHSALVVPSSDEAREFKRWLLWEV